MNKHTYKKSTDLLALVDFAVFALCIAGVLLAGAGIYRNLLQRGSRVYEHRVAAYYVSTRFHQASQVSVEEFCGLETMTARETFAGRTFLTRVYCYEGQIRELFAAGDAAVSPEDGETVMAAQGLSFAVDAGLLCVQITHTDGSQQQVLLALPAWKEALP